MDVQDTLLKTNWNTEQAITELKTRPAKQNKRMYHYATTTNSTHHQQNGNPAKKQRRDEEEDCGDSDEKEYQKDRVFESDSDEEFVTGQEMSIQRKQVYEFFNNANVGELTSIKTCSMKKAEIIIENRPYRNWEELVGKFQEKPLQTELLNNAQEYLDKRNSLKKLMKKCRQIVFKLEKAVEEGAGITEQPYTLNEGLNLSDYQMVIYYHPILTYSTTIQIVLSPCHRLDSTGLQYCIKTEQMAFWRTVSNCCTI